MKIKMFLGEKCDIRFEVNLEQHLNKFEDILVLHLENGKDIFISVSGDCQRSCFTTSISVLCRCSLPILLMSPEQLRLAVSNYCHLNCQTRFSNVLSKIATAPKPHSFF